MAEFRSYLVGKLLAGVTFGGPEVKQLPVGLTEIHVRAVTICRSVSLKIY
ncbi:MULTISPECIES: hypothetical protein [unclassified Amycolatopsis]